MLNTTYHFLDLTAKGRDENPDAPKIGCAITTNIKVPHGTPNHALLQAKNSVVDPDGYEIEIWVE